MLRLTGFLALTVTFYFFFEDRGGLLDVSRAEAGFSLLFTVQTMKFISAGRQCSLAAGAALSKMLFAVGLLAWAIIALVIFMYVIAEQPPSVPEPPSGDTDIVPNSLQMTWLLMVLTAQYFAMPKPPATNPAPEGPGGAGETPAPIRGAE